LLTVLGVQAGVSGAWRIDLPVMCFGAGAFSFGLALFAILLNLSSDGKVDMGHPSLFMLIAPPSVAAMGLAHLQGRFDSAATAMLGCDQRLMS